MEVVTAQGGALTTILDGTYPIWGEALTRTAYEQWNRAQIETAWGRNHLRRVALIEGASVVSSAKRYDLTAWVNGVRTPVLGIGAVFTPAGERQRGHARRLVEALIDDARERGCQFALLFSEIGASYYERLGFRVVPLKDQTLEIVQRAGAPAVLMRAGDARDFETIADLAARARVGAAFALDRGADFLAFGITRRRLLAGLGPAGLRAVEFFVTDEADRAVAYLVLTRGPQGLVLEDCGDRDPTGARVGAMLQVLAARSPTDGPMVVQSRVPPGFQPPQWRVTGEVAASEIMMVRPIDPHQSMTFVDGTVVYPHLDVF